jgi:hypothetical protein
MVDESATFSGASDNDEAARRFREVEANIPKWVGPKGRQEIADLHARHNPPVPPVTEKLADKAKAVGKATLTGLSKGAAITGDIAHASTQPLRAVADVASETSEAFKDRSQGKRGRSRIHIEKAFEAVGRRVELVAKPFRSKKTRAKLDTRSLFQKEAQREDLGKKATVFAAASLVAGGALGVAINTSNRPSKGETLTPIMASAEPKRPFELDSPAPEREHEFGNIGIIRAPGEQPEKKFAALIKKSAVPDKDPGIYTEADGSSVCYVDIPVKKIGDVFMAKGGYTNYQAYDIYYDRQSGEIFNNLTITDHIDKELAEKSGLLGDRSKGTGSAEIDVSSLPKNIVPIILNNHPSFDKVIFRIVKDGSPFMDDVFGGLKLVVPKNCQANEGAKKLVLDMYAMASQASFLEPSADNSPEQSREKMKEMIDTVNSSMDWLREYKKEPRLLDELVPESPLQYNPPANFTRMANEIRTTGRGADDIYANFEEYMANIWPPNLVLPNPETPGPIPDPKIAMRDTAKLLHEIADFAINGDYINLSQSAAAR